jgi:HlyD family secretion protein
VVSKLFFPKTSTDGMPVSTEEVTKRPIERSVISSGQLESAEKQEFFTPVDSTLMELSVKVGDQVKKNQVLGRLDTLELGRQYENAKANLAIKEAALARGLATNDDLNLAAAQAQYQQAKNNLDRTEHLHKEGVININELEAARVNYNQANVNYQEAKVKVQQGATAKEITSLQTQVDLARQEVAQAKERLDMAIFVAKDDGVVLEVEAKKGSRVSEGSRIMVVGNDSELEVVANVNEIDAGELAVGQRVKITCPTLPGKEFNGEVTRVAAVAVTSGNNSDKISVPVTVSLQQNLTGLKPGYTVDISIITLESKEFLTVPFEAVVNKDGHNVVYVVQNGIAKECKVKTEQGNELFDIVLTGLKKGDKVILNPAPNIEDGQKVMIGENQ